MRPQILFAAIAVSFLLGCVAAPSPLQRTPDKTVRLGRTSDGFRIVSHDLDLTMKGPAGWRVALVTEEPLRDEVVCVSPDKKTSASVSVDELSVGGQVAPPDDYLRALRGVVDKRIEMHPAGSVTLPDGRQFPVWRFSSDYWGEHLSTVLVEGKAIVEIEVEDRSTVPRIENLRQVLEAMVASYQRSDL